MNPQNEEKRSADVNQCGMAPSAQAEPRDRLIVELSSSAAEVLCCLFFLGPTWDGDVPSKSGRDELVDAKLVARGNGWQWLTRAGIDACFLNNVQHEKNKRDSERRARDQAEARMAAELRKQLELERVRLAGCGVAATANTPASAATRIARGSPYWSASYGDVCAAVDREMKLRDEQESTVRQFIGWLSADISELHRVEVPRLAKSWEAFKARLAEGTASEPPAGRPDLEGDDRLVWDGYAWGSNSSVRSNGAYAGVLPVHAQFECTYVNCPYHT